MTAPQRVASLDIIRAAVMVLMAIDHVGCNSGVPCRRDEPRGFSLTGGSTHFCAPAFVFLDGTAAFLHGRKLGERRALLAYSGPEVHTVLLELTVIRASWTFKRDYSNSIGGSIWMLGGHGPSWNELGFRRGPLGHWDSSILFRTSLDCGRRAAGSCPSGLGVHLSGRRRGQARPPTVRPSPLLYTIVRGSG